jgi:hypothetical protein
LGFVDMGQKLLTVCEDPRAFMTILFTEVTIVAFVTKITSVCRLLWLPDHQV